MKNVYPSEVVRYIDQVFGWAKPGGPVLKERVAVDQLAPFFHTLVEMVDLIPTDLLPGDERRVRLVIATEQIKGLLDMKGGFRAHLTIDTPGIGAGDPVTHIRAALLGLPDQVIPKGTSTLAFLNDSDLAESLRGDIATGLICSSQW